MMTNKHKVFAESMRNIMRNEEKNQRKKDHNVCDGNPDEDSRSLQEMLEQKFDELFGSVDDNE